MWKKSDHLRLSNHRGEPGHGDAGLPNQRPYPCQKAFLQNCKSATASAKTGLTIYVGPPTGTARFLPRRRLNGRVPPLNECPSVSGPATPSPRLSLPPGLPPSGVWGH
jgi:hypothetical protein